MSQIVLADAEVTALSKWDAIAADIAIATEESQEKTFDYRDKKQNKEARSWVASLRRLKGDIERARKDAKAVHIERGKAVDETAKLLEASVQGLIEPHEQEIKALEAEEQARISIHKAVLGRIAAFAEGASTSQEAQARIKELEAIDASTLEEFSTAGTNRKQEALEKLQAAFDMLLIQEGQQAELEKLRAEKAARDEADRLERIKQEAIEADRKAREVEAARQRLEAEELAAKERERTQAALIAQQKAEEEAQKAKLLLQQKEQEDKAREEEQARLEWERIEKEEADARARQEKRIQLIDEIAKSIQSMESAAPLSIAISIVDESIHDAVFVNWSLV
jgi:hypothetical protein